MASQQISYDLYKWLSPIQVLPANLRYKSNGNFQLDKKSAEGLMNGSLICKLLLQLANDYGAAVNGPLLSSIKQSNTPAAKVYNWNILSQSFIKLNITISKQTQKQITSGNFSTLNRLLLDLHKKFTPKKIQKKQQDNTQEINLKKIQVLQNYSDCQTFLQLVIMIISQNLSLTPKQTASTLNQNAKYYAHMVVKGIKNNFAEIILMIDTFIQEIANIMFLCQKNPQKNTIYLLDLIKPTLISREPDVAKKGAMFFKVFLYESLKYNSKNLVYQILCRQGSGFDFLYMALKRHPDLTIQFTQFLYPLMSQAMKDFFQVHLKRTINNQQEYLKILLKILEGFTNNPQSKAKLKQSGLIDIWLKNSQDSFNNKKNKEQNMINQETKLIYLELLCNLWKQYSSEINQEEAEELLMKGIQQLKKNTRKQIYTVKIPALLRLFDFLHYLADSKNKVAAILYKKLIFLFIENHQQEEFRQIILSNFVIMLKKYPTIPIDFLVDPLLKQLINSQGKTYILNIYDFQFLIQLCKHPKMDVTFGLSYLEYFSKLYIKSFIYAKNIIRLIQILTNRFCQEETIIQFLKKNVQSTLNLYGILVLNKKKLSKQNLIINKQKKSLAIQLIKHYIELQHNDLNQFILQKITGLYTQWLEEKHYTDKGLKYLINLYGDVDDIILQYKISQTRKLQHFNDPQQTEQTIVNTQNQIALQKPSPKSQSYKQFEYMKEKGIGYKPKRQTSKTRMEEHLQNINAQPNPKVLKDIQTLKQKLKQDANKRKQQQNNEIKKINQQNNLNSLQLLQRNISLGYAKLLPFQQDKILFDFDSVKVKQLKISTKFYSLKQLQQQDSKSAQIILKQYSKQIKSLFLKYALISSTNQSRKDDSSSMMSYTEIIKMIKQKNVSDINKLIISDMISSINYNKRKQKNVLSGIQQSQFNQFLIKLTDYTIQQQKNSKEIPFGVKLQNILKMLFQGELFYQNKFRIKQSSNILKLKEAINTQQENITIPEGYKKVRQNQIDLIYTLGENDWGIKPKYQIGYEIADWLIYKCLGIHIMTPIIQINQRYNLIQIPKPIKIKMSKQETEAKIKNDLDGQNLGNINQKQSKKSDRIKKTKIFSDKRSLSHRALNKTKTDPLEQSEEYKQKVQKQFKYAEKLRQNLQKLKQKAAQNDEQKLKQQEEKKKKQKKKEQDRKKYLQSNKQKLKQLKIKQAQQKSIKQNQQKQQKERLKAQMKKKQQQYFQKHKEAIKQKMDKINQKKREIENSKQKKIQKLQKIKQSGSKNQNDNDKIKMLEIKNNLENGQLHDLVAKYDKQLTSLFESYWTWDKKRIQLNSFALMFKDFHLTPELIYPKTLAQTFKSISKGQNLDYEGFKQCVIKCAYRSQKLTQEHPSEGQQNINIQIGNSILQKLRMNQPNYRQVIKQVKNHLS